MVPDPEEQSSQFRVERPRAAIAVELLTEREEGTQWEYDAQWIATTGALRRIVLRLSWADYQHWAPGGDMPPSQVAEAVLRFIASRPGHFEGLEVIDASTARRRVNGADAAIRDELLAS